MASVVSFSGGVVIIRPEAAIALSKAVLEARDIMAQRGQTINPQVLNLAIELSSAAGNTEPAQPVIEHAYEHEHITTNEAAEILGCSTRYVRKLAADGRLPGQFRGQSWFFNREDIDVFKEHRR